MLYAANMCSPFTSCRPHRINWHFCVVFNWSTKRILLVLIWTFFRAMRNEMILTKRDTGHTLCYTLRDDATDIQKSQLFCHQSTYHLHQATDLQSTFQHVNTLINYGELSVCIKEKRIIFIQFLLLFPHRKFYSSINISSIFTLLR